MLESIRIAINDVLTDDRAKVPAKLVAGRMGVPLTSLYSYGQIGSNGRDIPLVKLAQLVLASEDTRPIAALCREVGGYFLPLPAMKGEAVSDALVLCIKDFGAAAEEVAADLRGGKLTDPELRRIRADIGATQGALAVLLAAVEAQAQREQGRKRS